MSEYIRICDVEKYYGNGANITKAVDRVSFSVGRGEFVGVMGASGSGKTTLLNMLSTIDRVTAGHIFYGNTDITELSEDGLSEFRKGNLGFVFQDYNLLDTLNRLLRRLVILPVHHIGNRNSAYPCHFCNGFQIHSILLHSALLRYGGLCYNRPEPTSSGKYHAAVSEANRLTWP